MNNNLMKKLILQFFNFIGISGIGWILDYGVYTLLAFISLNLFINNVISAFFGITFVFIFSTRLVFKNNGNIPVFVKYFIYVLYQVLLIYFISKLLVYVNSIMILHFSEILNPKISALISKILVTPITMILNFFVMKYITEKI